MPTTGFHSEWSTIGDTRVYLQCRASFPGERMHFMANVAVKALEMRSKNARLVRVFFDDKSSVTSFTFASDAPEDKDFADDVVAIINDIFCYGNDMGEMIIVPVGDKHSDHYDHMEHLSVGAEVAVDRWRHSDAKYQEDVSEPS